MSPFDKLRDRPFDKLRDLNRGRNRIRIRMNRVERKSSEFFRMTNRMRMRMNRVWRNEARVI
jgi:hypothetical protein